MVRFIMLNRAEIIVVTGMIVITAGVTIGAAFVFSFW
jgi:hypothetical protein